MWCINCCRFKLLCAYALFISWCFFTVFQQRRVKWAQSVRKAASRRNLLLQTFGNTILYCLEFTTEIQQEDFIVFGYQSEKIFILAINPRTVHWIRELLDEPNGDYKDIVAQKPHSNLSDTIRTPKFLGEIQAMIDNDPIKCLRDMSISEFLIM